MPIFSSLFSRSHAASPSWKQLVFPTLLIGLVVAAYARLRMAQHQDQLEDKESAASTAARQRGNEPYKNKDFERAIEAYQEAASLAPNDPAPLSNLSAVCFETGRYADAANFIRQALDLSQAEPDQSPRSRSSMPAWSSRCCTPTPSTTTRPPPPFNTSMTPSPPRVCPSTPCRQTSPRSSSSGLPCPILHA